MTADNSGGAKSGKKYVKRTRRESFVWARITPEERELVEKLSDTLGLSVAEFLRYLILQELERRSLLDAKLEKIRGELESKKQLYNQESESDDQWFE
jgi:predicted Fe-S protein YdhL (DUF1289 family)